MLGIPKGINKLFALGMLTHNRGSGYCTNQSDAMAQLAETASLQYLVLLGQRAIRTILIYELIHALRVEEVLDSLAIPTLPLRIGPAPLVVECNVHGHTPRVVAEVVTTITARFLTWLGLRHAWPARHLHLATIILAHIGIQSCYRVCGLMQELTTLLGALLPQIGSAIVGPPSPYLVESGNVVRRVGIAVTKTIRRKSDEFGLRVDEIHLLRPLLLWTKAWETTFAWFWSIFLRLNAVQYVLRLGLVVNACVIAPTVRGKNQGCDKVQLAIAGSTVGITCAIGLTAPGKIALAVATLVLHVLLTPAPQAVEYIFLAKLHGYHHTVRHTLGTGVVVLNVGYIPHRVAHLEIHLVGPTKHIVKHLFQFSIHLSRLVAHLNKHVTALGMHYGSGGH